MITINVPQRRPADDDAAMMHAWSIGTTRTAQAHAAQHEKAECPPEVYIG